MNLYKHKEDGKCTNTHRPTTHKRPITSGEGVDGVAGEWDERLIVFSFTHSPPLRHWSKAVCNILQVTKYNYNNYYQYNTTSWYNTNLTNKTKFFYTNRQEI